MPLQNFVNGSVISAAWLNGVDILATTVFQNATTVSQALAALGLGGAGGANYTMGPPTAGVTLTINGLAGSSALQVLTTGVQIGAPAGGDKGSGTINAAVGYYVNGVLVNSANPLNQVASKANNTNRNTTVTLTADPDLSLAISAAGIYAIKLYLPEIGRAHV